MNIHFGLSDYGRMEILMKMDRVLKREKAL